MEKYAIFLDIDDTLSYFDNFPNGGVVSKENVDAINEVRKQGHYVFLNTGRATAWISRFVLDAVEVDGIVSGIGTQVLYHGEVIYEHMMDNNVVAAVLKGVESAGSFVLLGGADRNYIFNRPDYPIQNNPIVLASAEDFEKNHIEAKIQKVELFPAPDEAKAVLEKYLQYFHHDGYSEGCPLGVSKAKGMLVAAEKLGIPQKNCIAMGDSINDVDMLKAAGISVAMGNADEEVKALADFVSKPCREHGVAYAIKQLVLKK